jgi:hypothetical protein
MTKDEFAINLRTAAARCWELAQELLLEPIPAELRFNFRAALRPGNSAGLIKYFGGRLLKPSQLVHLNVQRTGQLLWVNGSIPRWINLSLMAADAQFSYIEVASSGVLTADDSALYYRNTDVPPFHVLSPPVPDTWHRGQRVTLRSKTWAMEIFGNYTPDSDVVR